MAQQDVWYPYDHDGQNRDTDDFDPDMWQSDDGFVACDDVCVLRQTEKALLVVLPSGRETWVPISCLCSESEVNEQNDTGTLIVKTWWLEKQPWY